MPDEIPTYFARERMEVSRLPRAPAGIADVGAGIEALGLIGFGRILSGISSDALQNLNTVRSEAQELEGTSQWERAHTEFFTGLVRDQDFENYGKKYKAFAKSLRRQLLKKGLTGDARRNLEAYMENQQVGQEKKVAAAFLAKQRDFGRVKAFQSVINFEQAGDSDGAVSAINHARNVGFMSAEEAFARKQNVNKNIETFRIENFLYTNPAVVPEMIDAAEHLNPQEKNELRSRARTAQSRLIAEQKAKYEQYVEQTEQDWLVKLRGHQLTENEIMASTLEVDKKQEWLKYVDEQAKEVLTGEDIITDEVVKGELESMAYDIFTGAISLPDFQKKLKDARYMDKTIDDTAYDEIFSLAQREYKTYQATAIKTAIDEAKMQLIDLPSDMSLRDQIHWIKEQIEDEKEQKQQIERVLKRRQLQFWHHGQYRRALSEWFAKNPDATADEIYIESKKLLTHYRRREISEIKGLLSEAEKRLQTVSPDVEEMKKKYPEIWEAAQKVVGERKLTEEEELLAEYKAIQNALPPEERKKLREIWDKAAKQNVPLREFLTKWREYHR